MIYHEAELEYGRNLELGDIVLMNGGQAFAAVNPETIGWCNGCHFHEEAQAEEDMPLCSCECCDHVIFKLLDSDMRDAINSTFRESKGPRKPTKGLALPLPK